MSSLKSSFRHSLWSRRIDRFLLSKAVHPSSPLTHGKAERVTQAGCLIFDELIIGDMNFFHSIAHSACLFCVTWRVCTFLVCVCLRWVEKSIMLDYPIIASSTKSQSWYHESFLFKPTMRSHRALWMVLSNFLANRRWSICSFYQLTKTSGEGMGPGLLILPCLFPAKHVVSHEKEGRGLCYPRLFRLLIRRTRLANLNVSPFPPISSSQSGNAIVTYPPAQFSLRCLSVSSKRRLWFASCTTSGAQWLITR